MESQNFHKFNVSRVVFAVFYLRSANAFDMVQHKLLSFGKELKLGL